MKRNNFLKTALLTIPAASAISSFKPDEPRAKKGFKTEVLKTRTAKKINYFGITPIDFKLLGADTGNELSVFISSNNTKGFGPPLHVHHSFDEFFCVLEGDFVFQLDDEKYSLKPGETIYIPRNIKHCFDNAGDTSGTLLVAILPSKNIEEFFEKMGDILNSSKGQPDIPALVKLYKKFDSEIVGPQLKL